MKLCFETIRIENGEAHNLKYHNLRLNRTRKELFGICDPVDISEYLTEMPPKGLYRAKLIYGKNIESLSYNIYKPKKIEKLYLVESDIDYRYKYLDRSDIDALVGKVAVQNGHRADAQVCPYDILIVKDGLLTDTSIANIALKQNGIWYTPIKPLLAGTMRAKLIDEGKITPKEIHRTELRQYEEIALMNAMIGFQPIPHSLFHTC